MAAKVEDVADTVRQMLEARLESGLASLPPVVEAGTRLALSDRIVDVSDDVDVVGVAAEFKIQLEDGRWFKFHVTEGTGVFTGLI